MNSNIVRFFMVTALALPMATLAQTDTAAAATTPAASAPASAATTTTTAPTPGVTKIGVISIQDAILATNEGQKDFEALGKKFEPERAEI